MRKIEQAIVSAFPDFDTRPTYEWASENLLLPESGYGRPGRLDFSESRHFLPIYDKLDDEYCREVNYRKPVRCGGSMIGDTWISRTVVTDPGPALDLFQTDEDAEKHAAERTIPLFANNKVFSPLLPPNGPRKTKNYIQWNSGFIWRTSGPAISNLQRFPVRYLRCSEPWMWPQGRLNEAKGRLGDYVILQNYKVFCESQGGPQEGVRLEISDWHVQFEDAEIWEWEVACLSCDKYFDPVFTGVRADGSFWGVRWEPFKLPSGDWDIAKCLPSVRFECPHCGQAMLDGPRTKREWNRTGRYRLTNREYRKKASFHHESQIFFPWEELVDLWLKACNAAHAGDLRGKIQFFQKRRAMDMDEETLLRGGLSLKRIPYEIGEWKEERLRFLHVDCQKEGVFWWTVRACSGRKTRRLGFGKAFSFAEVESIRDKFQVPSFVTTAASKHPFSRVTIDSRWNTKGPKGVYAACCEYGWIAVQGDKKNSFWHQDKRTSRQVEKSYSEAKSGDPECPIKGRRPVAVLIQFSKSQMNALVQMLIDNGDWEEPEADPADELEKEYNAQMSSRSRRVEFNKKTNAQEVYWREGQNDHARDLANQHVFAMVLTDQLPDPVTERLSKTEEAA